MARPIWKGHISFGLVEIPVGVASATRTDELRFNQLDEQDHAPVGYKRVNKRTGEEVPYERIVKGFQVEKDEYVVISQEELARVHPEATSTIDIFAFVKAAEIDVRYYDKPYYLEPSGKKGRAKAYALLRETLRETERVALAKVVLRTRQHLAAILPFEDALVMETLRFHHELRGLDDLALPSRDLDDIGVRDSELRLARTLVDELSEPFRPEDYRDAYRDEVIAYVERKRREGEIVAATPAAPRRAEGGEVVDIMELLKRSVDAATNGRKKRKAGGR